VGGVAVQKNPSMLSFIFWLILRSTFQKGEDFPKKQKDRDQEKRDRAKWGSPSETGDRQEFP
jgi:hypothetical protein